MDKYVAKFGVKYLQEYTVSGELISMLLTDELFNAKEIDRSDYHILRKLIDVGADIKEITVFESSENWDIKDELEELEQDEKRDQEKQ